MRKYPLQIYIRNEGTSLDITGDEGIMTIETRVMMKEVPDNIDDWGCKYRRMADGRCFVIMRAFIPTSFLFDLLMGESNKQAKDSLSTYIAREFHRVMQDRESEKCKKGAN